MHVVHGRAGARHVAEDDKPARPASGPVLHFIDTTGPGGAETIFLQVAAGLRNRGWESRAVVIGPGWVLDGARELDLPVDLVRTDGRFDLRYLWQLHALVRRHGVKLIHAHLFSPAVYASLVAVWRHTPVVATFHGASDTERGGWTKQLRYRLIGTRATIVCVSESLADAVGRASSARRHVRVVHNGVDVERFSVADGRAVRHVHGIPDETFLIGTLGNIREAKDYPTLLRAAAEFASDGQVSFAIVGERTEPLYGELVRLRDELGLQDRVSFWGFRRDVPETLAAFDALAISSHSEGFSLAAVQAMAAGKPVVATRCGGPEEIINDGVDGLLVPSASPSALAAALRRVADTPALRERLASAGRRTVVKRFSLEAMLDAYEKLYIERLHRD